MGGNLVLKLLGEWGGQVPPQVKAGVGISPGHGSGALGRCAAQSRQSRLRVEISPRAASTDASQIRALSRALRPTAPARRAQLARIRRPDYGALLRLSRAPTTITPARRRRGCWTASPCRHWSCMPKTIPSSACCLRPVPEAVGESQHHLHRNRTWRPLRLPRGAEWVRRPLGGAPSHRFHRERRARDTACNRSPPDWGGSLNATNYNSRPRLKLCAGRVMRTSADLQRSMARYKNGAAAAAPYKVQAANHRFLSSAFSMTSRAT